MKFLFALLISATSFAAFADCSRIISQSPYITHQLEYLGLKSNLVGTSRYEKSLALPTTGGLLDPDNEAIRQLNADLWITSDWTAEDDFNAIAEQLPQALRLNSFGSMAQIENNLLAIAKTCNDSNAHQLALAFAKKWREQVQAIAAINSSKPNTLLISSCSGQPYAFGKDSFLSDLFQHMGFKTVGNQQRITHLPITPQLNKMEEFISAQQPQLVIIFERQLAPACQLMQLPKGTRIITLDGTDFLQPAPVLLQGLLQLKQHPTLF